MRSTRLGASDMASRTTSAVPSFELSSTTRIENGVGWARTRLITRPLLSASLYVGTMTRASVEFVLEGGTYANTVMEENRAALRRITPLLGAPGRRERSKPNRWGGERQ